MDLRRLMLLFSSCDTFLLLFISEGVKNNFSTLVESKFAGNTLFDAKTYKMTRNLLFSTLTVALM